MSVNAAIALLMVLVLGNYWLSRSVLYPPLWFCGVWLLDLSLYRLDLTPVDELHSNTIGILALGAVVFSVGGLMALLAPKNLFEARFILTRFPPRNKIVKPAVTLFLLCGLPLLVSNLLAMAAQGTGNTVFQRARTGGAAAGQASGASPIGTYFILWALYAAPLFLIERRDKVFWLMTSIAFIASILSTGRLPILMRSAPDFQSAHVLGCSQICADSNRHIYLLVLWVDLSNQRHERLRGRGNRGHPAYLSGGLYCWPNCRIRLLSRPPSRLSSRPKPYIQILPGGGVPLTSRRLPTASTRRLYHRALSNECVHGLSLLHG